MINTPPLPAGGNLPLFWILSQPAKTGFRSMAGSISGYLAAWVDWPYSRNHPPERRTVKPIFSRKACALSL